LRLSIRALHANLLYKEIARDSGLNVVLESLKEVNAGVNVEGGTYRDLVSSLSSSKEAGRLLNVLRVKVKRAYWKEEKSKELLPVSKDFYLSLRAVLDALRPLKERDSSLEREFKELMKILMDLIRLRLQKIVSLALSSKAREHLNLMSLEEGTLYSTLSALINRWEEELVRSLEGGS